MRSFSAFSLDSPAVPVSPAPQAQPQQKALSHQASFRTLCTSIWTCHACTFSENPAAYLTCHVCHSSRDLNSMGHMAIPQTTIPPSRQGRLEQPKTANPYAVAPLPPAARPMDVLPIQTRAATNVKTVGAEQSKPNKSANVPSIPSIHQKMYTTAMSSPKRDPFYESVDQVTAPIIPSIATSSLSSFYPTAMSSPKHDPFASKPSHSKTAKANKPLHISNSTKQLYKNFYATAMSSPKKDGQCFYSQPFSETNKENNTHDKFTASRSQPAKPGLQKQVKNLGRAVRRGSVLKPLNI